MTIHIPRPLLISGIVACCLVFAGLVMKQAPELARYAKIEGM
jgi:hypothetical protein